jgi:hypothetical protein
MKDFSVDGEVFHSLDKVFILLLFEVSRAACGQDAYYSFQNANLFTKCLRQNRR